MLQTIIVIFIGIAVVIYLMRRLFFRPKDKNREKNPCSDCSECPLHPENKA
jgi:hypothetical protein